VEVSDFCGTDRKLCAGVFSNDMLDPDDPACGVSTFFPTGCPGAFPSPFSAGWNSEISCA